MVRCQRQNEEAGFCPDLSSKMHPEVVVYFEEEVQHLGIVREVLQLPLLLPEVDLPHRDLPLLFDMDPDLPVVDSKGVLQVNISRSGLAAGG